MHEHKSSQPQPEVPFQPIHDRLLVKWEPESARVLSIWTPESARRPGALGSDRFLRIGRVVATGPGDPCQCVGKQIEFAASIGVKPESVIPPGPPCERCHAGRIPMQCKVGDRILYDHPSDKEVTIEGEQYVILHEEQHVLAVIE